MKQYCLTLALLSLFVFGARAQESPVRKSKMNVMGTSHEGFSIKLPYGKDKAYRYWVAYLKDQGKVSEKRNYIEIKEAPWLNSSDFASIFARVEGDSNQSTLWMGLSAEADEGLLKTVEEEVQMLPGILRKYELQFKIQDAEQAASFLSKELRNAQREQERLQSNLERNAQDKQRLEEALQQNAADKDTLEQQMSANAQEQIKRNNALQTAQKQLENLRNQLQKLQGE